MGYEGEEEGLEASDLEVPTASAGSAADLSFLNQPFDEAEGDWSFD